MKRIICFLCALAMLFSGCSAPAPERVEEVATEAPTELVSQAPSTEETTEETIPEGEIFLKVSAITFSVVGESEDIYLGLVPADQVTWESENPEIVTVQNGVLTATGVGETTIRASFGEKTMTCTAGCLAEDEAAFESLHRDVQSTPKRLPPVVDLTEPCTYFDNAALVGDSISYILSQNEAQTNYLGDMLFLARGGVSMNGFVRYFKNIYFRGKEMELEKAVYESGVSRVYFLMGSNDVAEHNQRSYVFDNWETLISRIRELNPDIELVLMSNTPEFGYDPYNYEKNGYIWEYNEQLETFAREHDCMFLDLAYYISDHKGRMPAIYSQDAHHLNKQGCAIWAQILRYYAEFEKAGGSLK